MHLLRSIIYIWAYDLFKCVPRKMSRAMNLINVDLN